MVAFLLKQQSWDDANEVLSTNWHKPEKERKHLSITGWKAGKYVTDIWTEAYAITTKKMKMKEIAELTSIDYEETGQIVLKDISYGQAKKEIKEYFSKHHGEIIDAADIQEALNIDISLALEILDDLENEGKIKAK